jgi:hypothetical protein
MSAPAAAPAPPPRRHEGLLALWDGLILLLVCLNLALLLFDSLYALGPLNRALAALLPGFHAFYGERIHAHFTSIDLVFVAFFIADVLLGWLVAVVERRHARWYHYPFIHWYDVLGCIPLGGFRLLRALRIVSLLLRLQRLGLIDMRRWRPYRLFDHYYQLLMEDLSDRVMIKICGELQDELNTRDDFSQSVIDRVLRPRKQRLIDGMALRIQSLVEQGYAQNRATLERLVADVVQRALDDNPDLARLKRLPMGERMADTLDGVLTDIVNGLVREAAASLRTRDFRALASRLADQGFDQSLPSGAQDSALDDVLVEILEVFKQKVLQRRLDQLDGELWPQEWQRSEIDPINAPRR